MMIYSDTRNKAVPLTTRLLAMLCVLGGAMCLLVPRVNAGAQGVVVTDDLGRTITLAHSPERIVSLEPSITEILYAVGAGNKIVADDYFADYPQEAKSKVHVNGIGPSRELMIGLQPDLIILFDQTFTTRKADDWQQIYGCPIYVANGGSYAAVEQDIRRLGQLTGNKADTNRVLRQMDDSLRSVTNAVARRPRPTVFVAVWDHPLMTAGRGTFIGNLIDLAGGVNVAAAHVSGYPTYSPEQLVADDPDFIITGNIRPAVVKRLVDGVAGLKLRAERDGNSYAVPDDWTARPGPRLALGLVALARVLHPECFTTAGSVLQAPLSGRAPSH